MSDKNYRDENKWISVDNRLPLENCRVLCYIEECTCLGLSHYQWNCSFNPMHGFNVENGGRVTHWPPLPNPPIEKQE